MTRCPDCGFVWNSAFEPSIIVYDGAYENDQTYSPAFRDHVNGRAERVASVATEGSTIVEVGCGQGGFLTLLDTKIPADIQSFGFDPAWRGEQGGGQGRTKIYRDYFTVETAAAMALSPDSIVSRHTIEHIPDPVAFLNDIGRTAKGGTRLFLETPCASWILEHGQVQDFFYEHCTLFTQASLYRALIASGYADVSVTHVFGGQYLWAEARVGAATIDRRASSEGEESDRVQMDRWSARKQAFITDWSQFVEQAAHRGPIFIWGAGAKGVTFSMLTDPEGKRIAAAIDNNPGKQNCYLPLTGIPILAPAALPRDGSTIVVMNANYLGEIQAQLAGQNINARIVTLS